MTALRAALACCASLFLLAGCSGGDGTLPDGALPQDDGGLPLDDSGNPVLPDGGKADTGPTTCGGVLCKANETCLGASCGCLPGYVPGANGCDAAPAGHPASHTQMEVCQKWKAGHVVTTPQPFTSGGSTCSPGTLAAGGITDTLVRINLFRWMTGLGDVTDDTTRDTGAQACAVIQAWNNPNSLGNPHMPPANATCYTMLGAQYAGMSNLAWGTSTADSIDLYVKDPGMGNAGSIGHRRWVLYPPLGKVGVGFVSGGMNNFQGLAQCLAVIGDQSGTGPKPAWYTWPPAGYVPVQVTRGAVNQGWAWTFHVKATNVVGTAQIAVKNLVTGDTLPVTTMTLGQGYGDQAISFYPSGWTPKAGDTYRVTVTGTGGPYVYDVSPVTCP
jgi:hypothetical protein